MQNVTWRRALAPSLLLVLALAEVAHAQPGATAVSPYFLVIVDNSGSMTLSTGPSGSTNTCGQANNRLSDAKCVLQNVVNGYGDVTFGLARFRHTCSGSCGSTSCGASCGCSCSLTCNATANAGQILVPIEPENQSRILE